MVMNRTVIALATSAALLGGNLAYAAPGDRSEMGAQADMSSMCAGKPGYGKSMGNGHGYLMDKVSRMAMTLNLTSEQRAAIRGEMDKVRPDVKKYQEQLVDSMQKLRDMSLSENVDNDQVSKYAELQGDAVTHLVELKVQTKQAIMKILTPEQQQQLKDLMSQKGHMAPHVRH